MAGPRFVSYMRVMIYFFATKMIEDIELMFRDVGFWGAGEACLSFFSDV